MNSHALGSDACEALTYLDLNLNDEIFGDKESPDLILMDINMPRPSGREVLRAITTDKSLRALPGGSR